MNKPLGCLSRTGIAAAAVALVLLGGAVLAWGGRPFSPGPLNAQAGEEPRDGVHSHAETAGQCAACHAAPWSRETMSDRCMACHSEVAGELLDPTSLHGALMGSSQSQACYRCHPEHRGAEAPLTRVDPGTFPHRATGYSLEGHVQQADGSAFACGDCHGENLSEFDPARCADCHEGLDAAAMLAHVSAFGADCLACHDGIDRYGAAFDHAQTAFPLAGGHATAACDGCHAGARSVADLQGAPQECVACHQDDDAHGGQLGPDCAACHTPDDWQRATFDHSQSAFPLVGGHVQVACQDCHRDGVYRGTPQECAACHNDPDFHRGLLGDDCASCHDSTGWSPARYDRVHTFPINHGEGGASPCQTCHPASLSAYTCYGCHEHDPAAIEGEHRDKGISDFQDCMRCHPTGQKEEGGED